MLNIYVLYYIPTALKVEEDVGSPVCEPINIYVCRILDMLSLLYYIYIYIRFRINFHINIYQQQQHPCPFNIYYRIMLALCVCSEIDKRLLC